MSSNIRPVPKPPRIGIDRGGDHAIDLARCGDLIGRWFNMPGTGMVAGFLVALVLVPTWPWLMPAWVDDWMYDPRA